MLKILRGIISTMVKKLRRDGTPDMRYKANKTTDDKQFSDMGKKVDNIIIDVMGNDPDMEVVVHDQVRTDPQTLLNNLLELNNLKLDFDVLEGSISTQYGIIKLVEPTLVVKASYKNV